MKIPENEFKDINSQEVDPDGGSVPKKRFVNKSLPKKVVIVYIILLAIFTGSVVVKVENTRMSGLSTYARGPLFEITPKGDVLEDNLTKYFAPTITIREVSNWEVVKLKISGKPLLSNKNKAGSSSNYKNLAATLDMEASKKNALAAAIALNGGVKAETNIVINDIDESGPAFKAGLRVGMSIIEVNQKRIHDPKELVDLVSSNAILKVKTSQAGSLYTVIPYRDSIGARLISAPATKLPKIDVILDRVGGSSAGLMMGIAIYDSLTPGRLTNLNRISGSGQISADGRVFPIEGIEEKLASAASYGVEVFFVSKSQEFKYQSSSMNIVRVANLKEAVEYLKST